MLKVRPDTKRGRGGGGGGGGGAVGFWLNTKSGRGGGGGVLSVSGPIQKGGGEGGQARIQNVLEGGAEELARIFLATTPILVFILETETEGGARAP